MEKDNRFVFYTDQATFDEFESTLYPVQRWVSKIHPMPNLGVPVYGFEMSKWPVLICRKDINGESN